MSFHLNQVYSAELDGYSLWPDTVGDSDSYVFFVWQSNFDYDFNPWWSRFKIAAQLFPPKKKV